MAEDLAIGDPVMAMAGAARPIRWIGSRRLACNRAKAANADQSRYFTPEFVAVFPAHRQTPTLTHAFQYLTNCVEDTAHHFGRTLLHPIRGFTNDFSVELLFGRR